MDVDIVKTSPISDSSNMDMLAMMMQMEKFPEFYEPFYTTTAATYQENELFNVNPNVAPPPTLIEPPAASNVNFSNNNNLIQQPMTPPLQAPSSFEKKNSMAAMREMIFRIAVMQPVHIDPESIKPPKRRNVKISKDPQSVAARHRRERISERIRILQRLVPGGTKMDTASMLDEAIHYVKFLKKQVQTLEQAGASARTTTVPINHIGFPASNSGMLLSNSSNSGSNVNNYSALLMKGCQPCHVLSSASKQLLS
ncbi:hypothetical protein RJT34_30719 [Clitoria ternatea]|uniref:BHLH domain-containing protein n=1 Tax=Clitoria ternatea TaxID=43366 RepID=A0AAN9EU15_CLITE